MLAEEMKEDDTHKDSEILDDLFVFYKQREEYLVHLFPDLCPAFPKDQAWQIGEAVGAFEEAVERLFQLSSADRGRLPGRVDDAARGDRERWSTMCQVFNLCEGNVRPRRKCVVLL